MWPYDNLTTILTEDLLGNNNNNYIAEAVKAVNASLSALAGTFGENSRGWARLRVITVGRRPNRVKKGKGDGEI